MKKLLISLLIVTVVLLSGTYVVGNRVENETQIILAKSAEQGLSSKLIRYDRHFLKATAVSEVTVVIDGEAPIVFEINSSITHYPYKAVITNQIRVLDPDLSKKIEEYFASKNWISSIEEINLLGQLTGQLKLLAGSYHHGEEHFATKALQLDYQVNLQDYSGLINLNWPGLQAQTSDGDFSVESVQLKSNFSSLSAHNEYDYFAEIANVTIQQEDFQSLLQGIELQGSSSEGKQLDTVDTSNEWKVALYEVGSGSKRVFTNNHIKLDIEGLYSPALHILSAASEDSQQVEKALSALLIHGAKLTLAKLNSQTPWGDVTGYLSVTLQPGALFSDVALNPFALLDYVTGKANFLMPAGLLEEPHLSEPLQMGLRTGFLKMQEQMLSFETQFKQGELTVNGRVIPL
ncbi:DUF945 family protein [Psychromonas sp.]|uniref:DUF945 family protein n=1 Tax=Psychromonas sp. TaxID=1884585 RepID=UPI0039E45C86